jgi:hypothetical protein
MIEFRRDPVTGYLYAYRDDILVGPVAAMGEKPPAEPTGGPRGASAGDPRPSARGK